MRRHEQLSLEQPYIEHSHARELAKISQILSLHPAIAEHVGQDLVSGLACPHTGARGMSGDQVLRVLLLKQMNGFSYRELEFHLADSVTYRTFCRFGALEPTPTRATLAENLKKVRAETLEAIGAMVLRYAAERGVERGRKVRVDSTVVETNVHAPTDSSLLWDGVRVLTRLLGRADEHFGFRLYTDHTRRAKRRSLAIQHTGSKAKRTAAAGSPQGGGKERGVCPAGHQASRGQHRGAKAGRRTCPLHPALGAGDRPDPAAGPRRRAGAGP